MDDQESRKNEIIVMLQKAADGREHISQPEFVKLTGISKHQVDKYFPDGGYTELLRLAGLSVHPNRQSLEVSDDEILADFHRIAEGLGSLPKWSQIESRSKLTRTLTRNRFGTKESLLKAYKLWLEQHDPSSSLLPKIESELLVEIANIASQKAESDVVPMAGAHPAGSGVFYGELINFRGLQHAPINEQGVVYLFGMVSHELGFLIEAVQTGFPDCHGKRKVKGNRWQQVRIEFEYQSRNFLAHGHDATLCDLIVCWEHNWTGCPIEVLCLKERIRELKSSID